MSDLEMKSFGPFEIKDAVKGEVEAVVSSLDTVDHDREVVRASAIKSGSKVKMSFYGHNAVFGEAPVGKGTITAENGKGILRGNFFMSTTRGKEAFETVKALGADGEWSIGFHVVKWSQPDDEWKAKGAERMLDEIELFEVSPVLRGASPNTATIGVKELEAPAPEPVADATGDPTPVEVALLVDTPADEMARHAAERQSAEDAEAKATAEVAAHLKAARDAEAKVAADVAAQVKAQRDDAMEEYHRVQRALKRMGYAA